MLSGPAFAQCAPGPTVVNGTTSSGTDTDGLHVTTSGTKVVVENNATVRGSGGPAIAVRLPASQTYTPVAVSVSGLVDGEQNDGIDFIIQAFANGYSFQALTLNVAAGDGLSMPMASTSARPAKVISMAMPPSTIAAISRVAATLHCWRQAAASAFCRSPTARAVRSEQSSVASDHWITLGRSPSPMPMTRSTPPPT